MDKTILGAVIGALATVLVGLLALVGVLFKANRDYRLGLLTERNKSEAQQSTEDATLRDDQREFISTLKLGAADWTTLVSNYVETAKLNAALTVQVASLEGRLTKLEERIAQNDIAEQDWEQERCGLENEILDQRTEILNQKRVIEGQQKDILLRDQQVEHLMILGETSARAQEFAEGANAQANRVIGVLATQTLGASQTQMTADTS